MRAAGCGALGLLLALGCARFPANPPLQAIDRERGYRFDRLARNAGNTDETFVVLALSGGGARAAAFAFGAIRALAATPLRDRDASLLDEVDVISAVSGGSFAAAYYGVHGREAFLTRFPRDVLFRPIERDLLLHMLAPWNWWRLGSWWYGRGDLADRYYAAHIFGAARFADLPRARPLVLINATDIGIGAQFSFVQEHFDRLCSDLDGVRVSRAVAASSAFPIALSPLTFVNYPVERCGYSTPVWVENARADLELNASRFERAMNAASYEDPTRRYIHLADGGMADNLGLRPPLLGLQSPSSPLPPIRLINLEHIRRVVLLVVDAEPQGTPAFDHSAHPPNLLRVLHAAATQPMANYSSDTIELARQHVAAWSRAFQEAGETPPVALHLVRVSFDAEPDPALRRALQSIGTRLSLPREDVERVVAAGGRLLRSSRAYRCLLREIGAYPVDTLDTEACPP